MMNTIHYINGTHTKRFLVFKHKYGDSDNGGMSDLVGSYDDLNVALEVFKEIDRSKYSKDIFDRIEGQQVDVTKYGINY